jgi:Flp pilus assembly protein TadD
MKLGLEYFKKGSFGIANRYFRDAVEKAPEDAEAWIGLAASYDRLRRFDLADQAYAHAIKLTGETVQILNDRGYSYMLRGDLGKARAEFLKAYELDPTNPTVINNIQLLNSSSASSNGYRSLRSAAAGAPLLRDCGHGPLNLRQSSNGKPAYCSASDAWACSEACR